MVQTAHPDGTRPGHNLHRLVGDQQQDRLLLARPQRLRLDLYKRHCGRARDVEACISADEH